MTIQSISAAQNIPKRFLEQILNDLKAAGILESRRGITGGYRLRRAPEQVTLAEGEHATVAISLDDLQEYPLETTFRVTGYGGEIVSAEMLQALGVNERQWRGGAAAHPLAAHQQRAPVGKRSPADFRIAAGEPPLLLPAEDLERYREADEAPGG